MCFFFFLTLPKNTGICILRLTEPSNLSAQMYEASGTGGANGSQSGRRSVLVSLSIWVKQTSREEMLNGIITPLTADPLFDFLCISVRLFQILFIRDGTSQSREREKKNKGEWTGWERREQVRV